MQGYSAYFGQRNLLGLKNLEKINKGLHFPSERLRRKLDEHNQQKIERLSK